MLIVAAWRRAELCTLAAAALRRVAHGNHNAFAAPNHYYIGLNLGYDLRMMHSIDCVWQLSAMLEIDYLKVDGAGTLLNMLKFDDFGAPFDMIRHFPVASLSSDCIMEYNWESGIPLALWENYYVKDMSSALRFTFNAIEQITTVQEYDAFGMLITATAVSTAFSALGSEPTDGGLLVMRRGILDPADGQSTQMYDSTIGPGLRTEPITDNMIRDYPDQWENSKNEEAYVFNGVIGGRWACNDTVYFYLAEPPDACGSIGFGEGAKDLDNGVKRWDDFLKNNSGKLIGETKDANGNIVPHEQNPDYGECTYATAFMMANYHSMIDSQTYDDPKTPNNERQLGKSYSTDRYGTYSSYGASVIDNSTNPPSLKQFGPNAPAKNVQAMESNERSKHLSGFYNGMVSAEHQETFTERKPQTGTQIVNNLEKPQGNGKNVVHSLSRASARKLPAMVNINGHVSMQVGWEMIIRTYEYDGMAKGSYIVSYSLFTVDPQHTKELTKTEIYKNDGKGNVQHAKNIGTY